MLTNILLISKRKITLLILGLISISLVLNFISSSWGRVFFFVASYLSIVSIILHYKIKPTKNLLLLTCAFILIGLSKYLWFCFEYIGNPDYNKYNSYFNTGQRLILGGVISYALFSMVDKLSYSKAKVIELTILVSFFIATIIGLVQAVRSPGRIDFYLGFATDSAYMYSTLSICSVIYLQQYKSLFYRLLTVAVLLVSLFMIFKTGTRNILISYPIILTISLLVWKKHSWRNIFWCAILLSAAFAAGYNNYIKPKINVTLNEIQSYEVNNGNFNGSLTARLAMWAVGYEAFKHNPLSMSLEKREDFFKKEVNETNKNSSALAFTRIHLHNEIIETASLQGIFGIIALLLTYALLLACCIRDKNNVLLGVSLTIITIGLTDVVFISREQTIFFSIIIIFAALHQHIKKKAQDNK
ncbi:O-antigen ligase [Buttiauxella noackiae ATCC 51607]|uniref:O-antigen ligase n=1 Tax=Buttiauxella noackiae ATCC 51607 TaxID=1354255 RepID=A0A1B7HIR9_9ENTR|nr:O-antigen ligase family protein [Buttiauxella noackiae]OAT15512.1 O-antigen ligase [Buttiauxella noackiae ATCC 51607]